MARKPNQLKKIPLIVAMLRRETDEDHGLTMAQIVERLAAAGVEAERKSVYRDFQVLRECGYDIVKRPGKPAQYALASREFELPELLLLVDAVRSSRFLTERKSAQLVERVKSLASVHQAALLEGGVHVERRIRAQNESVYYSVDAIQRGISQGRKVGFRYFKHGVDLKPVYRKDGALYRETPVGLVYADGFYYLVAFNERHGDFVRYRLDRMEGIRVLDEPAVADPRIGSFDIAAFALQAFGMFGGEKTTVTLEYGADAVDQILDRFGREGLLAIPQPGGRGRAVFTVRKSEVFFGWLAGFGTRVRIVAPRALAREYRAFLAGIVQAYGNEQGGAADGGGAAGAESR